MKLTKSDPPLMMGILNVTPDSFSEGGKYQNIETAREHALKAFLIETEGIKAEGDEQAAEIVRAREEAQEELAYYDSAFGRLTCRLDDIPRCLPGILKRDLLDLSQADREQLERYEELYKSFAPDSDEEVWEQFPIVELLDIAEAYLPGMTRASKRR